MTTNKTGTSDQTQTFKDEEQTYKSNRDITPNLSFSTQQPIPGQYSKFSEFPVFQEPKMFTKFPICKKNSQFTLFNTPYE